MKILLYGINFSPELIGTGKYTSELAARLAAHPALREHLGAAGFLHAQEHMETETVLARFEADVMGLLHNA